MKEIGSVAAIERLMKVRREGIATPSEGSPAVAVGMSADNSVKEPAIGSGDVLDIGDILQTALNLERRGAGIDELLQVVALIEVLEREEVALVLDNGTVGID